MQGNRRDFNSKNNPDLSTQVYGKVQPQAPQVEEAILGAVMLEKGCFTTVLGIINTPDCFYMDAHQKTFAAMLRLNTMGMDIDLLTVTEELGKSGDLEIVGGPYCLTRLTMNVVSGAHVESHCLIVLEKFL